LLKFIIDPNLRQPGLPLPLVILSVAKDLVPFLNITILYPTTTKNTLLTSESMAVPKTSAQNERYLSGIFDKKENQ
jgi:hypothetical protein